MSALLGLLALFMVAQGGCEVHRTTGYVGSEYPGYVADGTTTTLAALAAGRQIAAGSLNLPLGATVWVEDLGYWEIRDRGYLEARHVDMLFATRAEAYAVTGYRMVCVLR